MEDLSSELGFQLVEFELEFLHESRIDLFRVENILLPSEILEEKFRVFHELSVSLVEHLLTLGLELLGKALPFGLEWRRAEGFPNH